MKPKFASSLHRAGFTLVELLVVVVIIAVLASLGFMGLRKAMDSASRAKSTANMKQLVTTNHIFSADRNGAIMHAADTVVDGVKRNWSEHLLVTLNPELANNLDFSKPKGDSAARTMGIFSDSKALKAGKGVLPDSGHNSWRTFSYNNRIGLASLDPPGSKPFIRGSRYPYHVETPSKFIFFSQKILETGMYNQALQPEDGASGRINFALYNGFVMVAFYDGHVEMMSKKEFPTTKGDFTTGKWNEYWLGRREELPQL